MDLLILLQKLDDYTKALEILLIFSYGRCRTRTHNALSGINCFQGNPLILPDTFLKRGGSPSLANPLDNIVKSIFR